MRKYSPGFFFCFCAFFLFSPAVLIALAALQCAGACILKVHPPREASGHKSFPACPNPLWYRKSILHCVQFDFSHGATELVCSDHRTMSRFLDGQRSELYPYSSGMPLRRFYRETYLRTQRPGAYIHLKKQFQEMSCCSFLIAAASSKFLPDERISAQERSGPS